MVDNKGESIGNLELDIKVAEQIMERANGDPIPQYSNDIVAAMQVVEKLRERHHFELATFQNKDVAVWMVSVGLSSGHGFRFAMSASLPEAICRAALAAVEKK